MEISKFYIFNGVGDERYHEMNNRVKKFSINGEVEVEIDEYGPAGGFGWRLVELKKPVKGKEFTFKIVSVYKGTKWRDTCVAEIAFENPGIARWIKNPGNFPVNLSMDYYNVSLQKNGTLTGPGIRGAQCDTPFLGGSWKLKGDAVEFTFKYKSWTKCGNLIDSPKEDEWETNTVKESIRTLLPEP